MPDPIKPIQGPVTEPHEFTDEEIQSSILLSTKTALGVEPDFTPFDNELVMFINSALSLCNQLGIGPQPDPFKITGSSEKWEDFTKDFHNLDLVKEFVYKRVKLLFDPPQPSVITAYREMLEEDEWRLRVEGDRERQRKEGNEDA